MDYPVSYFSLCSLNSENQISLTNKTMLFLCPAFFSRMNITNMSQHKRLTDFLMQGSRIWWIIMFSWIDFYRWKSPNPFRLYWIRGSLLWTQTTSHAVWGRIQAWTVQTVPLITDLLRATGRGFEEWILRGSRGWKTRSSALTLVSLSDGEVSSSLSSRYLKKAF